MRRSLHLHRHGRFTKALGPSHRLALGVQGKRAALKNHFVLATHQMCINQRQAAIGHTLAHALLALWAFTGMKRRGVQHRQHLRPSVTRQAGRLVEPGVFANEQTHPHAFDLEHAHPVAGCEIAALVKHLVIGQLALVVSAHHLPFAENARAVVAARHGHAAGAHATAFGMAHHHMQAL